MGSSNIPPDIPVSPRQRHSAHKNHITRPFRTILGSGAQFGKMLLVRIVENKKTHDYFSAS